jgi:dTDP-4-amino-4,6-dideoxygalactose transaminase
MNKNIPFHRPYPFNHHDKVDLQYKLDEILNSGKLSNDKYVIVLENKIKNMYNVEYCLATSSCTVGLLLCLKYFCLSHIQLPAFNWYSDLYDLQFLDYAPLWNDINKDTWLAEEKYKAYSLYLHTFGNIGESYTPKVIYDASHCLGAKLKDIGAASVFSLAPTKLITACEGGIIITDEKLLYNKVLEWRNKMSRMSEIHAAVALQSLKYLDKIKDWKKKVFNYYKKHIPGQFQKPALDHNYNTIGFLNFEKLKIPKHIEIKRYYEPLKKGLKNTDLIHKNIICLPSWYGVDYKEIVNDILGYNNV